MADSWLNVDDRADLLDPNAGADFNAHSADLRMIKAGDPDTAPTFGLEDLKAGTVPVKGKTYAYPTVPSVGISGGNYTVNLSNNDIQKINITADGTLVLSNLRIGAFLLILLHDSSARNLTFPTCYTIGVTGTSAPVFAIVAGSTMRTVLNVVYDGAALYITDAPFHA